MDRTTKRQWTRPEIRAVTAADSRADVKDVPVQNIAVGSNPG